jgi:hypothetical protein
VFYNLLGPTQNITKNARYSIRMNSLKVPSTKVLQDRARTITTLGGGSNAQYYNLGGALSRLLACAVLLSFMFINLFLSMDMVCLLSNAPGFVPIQDLFDRGLLDFYAGKHVATPPAFVTQFPIPAFRMVRSQHFSSVLISINRTTSRRASETHSHCWRCWPSSTQCRPL